VVSRGGTWRRFIPGAARLRARSHFSRRHQPGLRAPTAIRIRSLADTVSSCCGSPRTVTRPTRRATATSPLPRPRLHPVNTRRHHRTGHGTTCRHRDATPTPTRSATIAADVGRAVLAGPVLVVVVEVERLARQDRTAAARTRHATQFNVCASRGAFAADDPLRSLSPALSAAISPHLGPTGERKVDACGSHLPCCQKREEVFFGRVSRGSWRAD